MSGDEVVVLMVSIGVAALAWGWWYAAMRVRMLVVRNAGRFIFVVSPITCLAMLWVVLWWWAADDVRYSGTYLTFYMAMGLAWVGFWTHWLGLFGISPRDDVLERQKYDLLKARDYAANDASVETWAHSEGKMVRENEILVIPVPAGVVEPTPTLPPPVLVSAPPPEPETPKWHLWWNLFFDGEPPF